MSTPAESPIEQTPRTAISNFDISFWLLIQVGLIAWVSQGFQLTASWPANPQQMAMPLVLAGQLVVLSFGFPRWLRSIESMLIVVASGVPFLVLASNGRVFAAEVLFTAIGIFAIVAMALRQMLMLAQTALLQSILGVCVVLFVIGFPLLEYAEAEFGQGLASEAISWVGQLSPLRAAISLENLHFPPLLFWGFYSGISLICSFWPDLSRDGDGSTLHKRQVIHRDTMT